MSEKVLITGITGFIGSHLAEKLLKRKYEVYGIVRYATSRDLVPIKNILEDIVLLTADITDYKSFLMALETANPNFIIHLAALTPVRYSFEHPFEFEKTNFVGTMNVAHAILELPDPKTRKLVAASTAEVYGLQEKKPFKEDLPLNPASPYAAMKVAADAYLRMMARSYDLNVAILRASNTYGRKHDKGFIVEYLITEMLKGNKIYIGAPESVRDYMYVTDHVNAYIAAMEKETQAGEVFNVGTGIPTNNRELAIKIANELNFDQGKIIFGAYPPGYPWRPFASDQPYIVLDSTKIKSRLGWDVTVPLDEGLKKAIEHWRNKKN